MGAKVVRYSPGGDSSFMGAYMHGDYVKYADYEALEARCNDYQRQRAELSDRLNGTPCAEIRWRQEKEALEAKLREARKLASEIRHHVYHDGCACKRTPEWADEFAAILGDNDA